MKKKKTNTHFSGEMIELCIRWQYNAIRSADLIHQATRMPMKSILCFSFSFPFLRQRRRFVSACSLCMCVAWRGVLFFLFHFYRIFSLCFSLSFPFINQFMVFGVRLYRVSQMRCWFIDSDGPCFHVTYDLFFFSFRKKKRRIEIRG